ARRGGGPGQRGGLLGREPLGQEDRPESEALALGDLGEQVARRGGMAGQPVEPQFRKIVHERFLTSGPSPRPSRDRTLVWTPVRINPPPGRHARSRPPRPCRPVLVTRYGTWRFRGWPSATSGWSKANSRARRAASPKAQNPRYCCRSSADCWRIRRVFPIRKGAVHGRELVPGRSRSRHRGSAFREGLELLAGRQGQLSGRPAGGRAEIGRETCRAG